MNGLRLARNYWSKKSSSRASVTLWLRNAASFPGSKSKRIMCSIHRMARKLLLTCSTAEASSSFITSCSVRIGRRVAPVAPSTWIIQMARWCIWRNAMSHSQRFHETPCPKIEPFKKRMGWRFAWVSSFGTDFNYDYRASFTQEEMAKSKVEYNFDLVEFPSAEAPGISVFYKDKSGNVFHTYSAYARGSENTINTYNYLDYVPKGRDEDGLPFTMAWLRHHDRYETGYLADADRPYWPVEAVRS